MRKGWSALPHGRRTVASRIDHALSSLIFDLRRFSSMSIRTVEGPCTAAYNPGSRNIHHDYDAGLIRIQSCRCVRGRQGYNADISQMPHETGRILGRRLSPQDVVDSALAAGCESIAYTYTEPTIYYEYARDCARLATETGLKNVFVTNGYMTKEMLADMDGHLHAANVDLKAFTDDFYRTMAGARLKPVLDSIKRMYEMGVWLELTTLLIPGHNDSPDELRRLAAFIASVSPDIPWHVSRFYPTYRLLDVPPTPVETVERAIRIGAEEGLHYVYGGNIPGHSSENTSCPNCGETVVERQGFAVERDRSREGKCPRCSQPIAGLAGCVPAHTSQGDEQCR